MDKNEFARAIAKRAGVTIAQALDVLDAARDVSLETLQKGNSVSLKGWMTISAKQMAERMGRNPKTGEPVPIPAKKRVMVKIHGSYKV